MLKATGMIPELCFYPQKPQELYSPSMGRGLRWCLLQEACTPRQAAGRLHTNSGWSQKGRGGHSPCRALGSQSPRSHPTWPWGLGSPHTPPYLEEANDAHAILHAVLVQ